MTYQCPSCLGEFPSEQTCKLKFDLCQAAEFEQPAYGAVHHLSVLCYWLQHNYYSRDGWIEARNLLSKFINEKITPNQVRKYLLKTETDPERNWRYAKGEKLVGVDAIKWRYTVAKVRLDTSEYYCLDVKEWAHSILIDSEELARSFPT